MLHEFLDTNRADILDRSRSKIAMRHVPTPTSTELTHGLPLFLDQMIAILRTAKGDRAAGHLGVSETAGRHGGALLKLGLTVGQVVQDYGSICQSVTELASELDLAITAEEFQTFNRCLDDAIAMAVTTFEQQRDQSPTGPGVAHLGFLAHEMRNLLTTAMLTFDAISRGSVGVHGSTGTLHGRSLRRMRALVDRTLADVRLESGTQKSVRVSMAELIEEIEVIATFDANERDIKLTVDAGGSDVVVEGDHQILASIVANLVQNAFKFTRPHGHVIVRAYTNGERVLIDVKDECGGLPKGKAEELFRLFEQRGVDRTGLGLGLAISEKGARASGGEIRVVDLPGSGCTFTIDLPRAPLAENSLATAAS